MNVRSAGLAAALAATAVAAYLAPSPEDPVVAPTSATARKAAPALALNDRPNTGGERSAGSETVLTIRPRDQQVPAPVHAGFGAAAWVESAASLPTPAVIAPPPPPPAPLPVAPPLPFKVIGRYLDQGSPALFLQYNDQNLVVRAGDTLAGQYKVESLDDTALTLLHMPTNQKQTLNVGAAP